MGITAKQRAATSLKATTSLSEAEVITVIKRAAGEIKGGGAGLLTTGPQNIGAHVNIVREQGSTLSLSLSSGKKLIQLCTFSAKVTSVGDKRTVQVGGLQTYKTSQSKLFFLIPIGPKQIFGMAPYKNFLEAVASGLRAADPRATVSISQPS